MMESKTLLQDLKNEFLHVILIPAPSPMHSNHQIRVSDNHSPDWYKKLYWDSGETWKRNHTIKFLKQISNGIFNYQSIYVQKLLSLIFERLGI